MKTKDERVIQLNRKIQSEAYNLVLFLAAASIFIKGYLLDLPVWQYVTELGIILLTIGYMAVRSMLLGHSFLDDSRRAKRLTVCGVFLLSIAAGISGGIRNYALYGDHYTGVFDGRFLAAVLFIFVSSAVFLSLVLYLLFLCNKMGQKRIEKQLRDSEEEE